MSTVTTLGRYLLVIEQRIIVPLLGLLLACVTIGVFIQVVLRYGFSTSFLWGEEVALFAFIWSVFMGAAIGVRRGIHLAFEVAPAFIRGRGVAAHTLLIDLSILSIALLIVVEGWTFSVLSAGRFSPAIGVNLFVPTLIIPASGVFMTLAILDRIVLDIRRIVAGVPA